MKNILSIKPDNLILMVIHVILALFVLAALVMAIKAKFSHGVTLTVGRGEYSLNWLLSSYAAIVGMYVMFVQMSGIADDVKMAILAVDVLLISCLFFLSDWFVNSVVYSLLYIVARN